MDNINENLAGLIIDNMSQCLSEALPPSVLQDKILKSSGEKVIFDFTSIDGKGVAISMHTMTGPVCIEGFKGTQEQVTSYNELIHKLEEFYCVENDCESLSLSFLKSRVIRALSKVSIHSSTVTKSNLNGELQKLEGRGYISPKLFRAPSVLDVNFVVNAFNKSVSIQMMDLNLDDYLPKRGMTFEGTIMNSFIGEIKNRELALIGEPLSRDDPRGPGDHFVLVV